MDVYVIIPIFISLDPSFILPVALCLTGYFWKRRAKKAPRRRQGKRRK
jgi:hypothetical protein